MSDFKTVELSEQGASRAKIIAAACEDSLRTIKSMVPGGRALALTQTKLQEAHYWAIMALTELPENVK